VTPDGPVSRRQIEDTTAARLAEIVAAAEQAAKGVIDEAEAEARERLADASEEADRIVAERLDRLAGLTEQLDLQAEALKRGAEALRAALAEARAEFGGAESLGGSRTMHDSAPPVEPEHEGRREPDRDPQRPAGPSLSIVGGKDPLDAAPFSGSNYVGPEPDGTSPPDSTEPPSATPGRLESPEPEFEPTANGTPAGARLLATQMAVSGSSREEIEQRLRSGFQIADATSILDAILGPGR
jgi:vacuolar-type H+-ATPase subunit H